MSGQGLCIFPIGFATLYLRMVLVFVPRRSVLKVNQYMSDYALFMAVKDRFEGVEWTKWAEDIRLRWNNACLLYTSRCV